MTGVELCFDPLQRTGHDIYLGSLLSGDIRVSPVAKTSDDVDGISFLEDGEIGTVLSFPNSHQMPGSLDDGTTVGILEAVVGSDRHRRIARITHGHYAKNSENTSKFHSVELFHDVKCICRISPG